MTDFDFEFDDFEEEDETEDVLGPEALVQRAADLGFVPLMRVIERLRPDAKPVGGAGLPSEEAVRFRHKAALSFDYADVTEVRPLDDGPPGQGRWEVTTTFLGLTGASSPLPSGMLSFFRKEGPDSAATRFLDVFHHRAVSLLYRAMVERDLSSEASSDGTDPWARRLRALAGVDPWPDAPDGVDLEGLLRLMPVLAGPTRRTAEGMEMVVQEALSHYLQAGATVRVEQFVPSWIELAEDDQCRLGQGNSRLGADASGSGAMLLGRRAMDPAAKVGLHVGPISFETYQPLREGEGHERLVDALRGLGHEGLEYEMTVRIAAGQVPRFVLGTEQPRTLGRDTWLMGRKREETEVTFGVDLTPRG